MFHTINQLWEYFIIVEFDQRGFVLYIYAKVRGNVIDQIFTQNKNLHKLLYAPGSLNF